MKSTTFSGYHGEQTFPQYPSSPHFKIVKYPLKTTLLPFGISDHWLTSLAVGLLVGWILLPISVQAQSFPAQFDLNYLDGNNGFFIAGVDGEDETGCAVSNLGDVNGDGIDDIAIGADNADPNRSDRSVPFGNGEAYVVFGRSDGFSTNLKLANLDGSNGFAIPSNEELRNLGVAVSGAGDINGDGLNDIVIASTGVEDKREGIDQADKVYIIYGSTDFGASVDIFSLDGSNGFSIPGMRERDKLGGALSIAGDVNGDGIDDFIIGAAGLNTTDGVSYVVYGRQGGFGASLDLNTLDGSNGFTFIGTSRIGLSGNSVSGAGDINNDGLADVIIGAYDADPSTNEYDPDSETFTAGESYVIFGSRNLPDTLTADDLNGSNGFTAQGTEKHEGVGRAVSNAGDVNNDGIDDFIVGSYSDAYSQGDRIGNSAGKAYVVFGQTDFEATFDLSTLDGSNGFVVAGRNAEDELGAAVSGVGDVNSDGIDDVVIGARYADPNGIRVAGESYVIFGSSDRFDALIDLATLDGSNGFTISGVAFGELGESVSGAGDINSDGTSDLILGASRIFGIGGAYVIFGRNPNSTPPPLSISTLTLINTDQGTSVQMLKNEDVLNLNALDLRNYNVLAEVAGTAEVSRVRFTLTNELGYDTITSESTEPYALFGTTNGNLQAYPALAAEYQLTATPFYLDAAGDEIAGTSKTITFTLVAPEDSRSVADLSNEEGFFLYETGFNKEFGEVVSNAGDVNGDGLDDIIMGAPKANPKATERDSRSEPGYHAGEGYVVFGRAGGFNDSLDVSNLNGTNGFTIVGVADKFSRIELGTSVSAAGDVNGDGIDDVIIGAPYAEVRSNGETTYNGGEGYVIFGRAGGLGDTVDVTTLDGSNGFALQGSDRAGVVGFAVSEAGDLNNDGIDDLVVGSSGDAHVVFGNSSGFEPTISVNDLVGTNGFTVINASTTRDLLGVALGSAGDVNNDGIDDLLVGAPGADFNNEEDIGITYVIFGRSDGFSDTLDIATLNGTNGFAIRGTSTLNSTGFSVSGAGDVNSDGIDDIVVGAPGAMPNGRLEAGETYVVFGRDGDFDATIELSALNGSNGFTIWGSGVGTTTGFAGRSVSAAGDVNGDGISDLVVGSPLVAPNFMEKAGESYVILGRTEGFDTVLDLAATNRDKVIRFVGRAKDKVGISVAGGGDINGDGLSDIIVGASGGQARVYVLFGSGDGSSLAETQQESIGITVRARQLSAQPDELSLSVDGQVIKTWTIAGSEYADYTHQASISADQNIRLLFADSEGRATDVQVDYLQLGELQLQTEAQAVNTATWQNGSCGGSFSDKFYCAGFVDFGSLAANTSNSRLAGQPAKSTLTEESISATIYPNPSTGRVNVVGVEGIVSVYNLQGRKIAETLAVDGRVTLDFSGSPASIYLIKAARVSQRVAIE